MVDTKKVCADSECLVFQYGSNCLESRLNAPDRLGGDAKCLGLAHTIEAFDFQFNRKTKCGHAAADIVSCSGKGRKIYGVLYKIPRHRVFRNGKCDGLKTLDEIEGEGKAYKSIDIRISHCNEEKLALTYVVIERESGIKTTCCYAKSIFDGLNNQGAPEEYLKYLEEKIKSNNPDICTGKWGKEKSREKR